MISQAYEKSLKTKVVSDFVKQHNRSPTFEELRFLLRNAKRQYPNIDEIGFAGYDCKTPGFMVESSATMENKNREAIFRDLKAVNDRINNLAELLELSFRGFNSTARRISHGYTNLENRLDNLILMNSEADLFLGGLEEDFDSQLNIDFEKSTVNIENGFCTIGKKSLGTLDLTTAKLKVNVVAEKGFISLQSSSPIESLKEDDGVFWEQLVYTKYQLGRVTLLVDIELPEPSYVGEFRFSGSPLSLNKKTTATLMYSTDGKAFSALSPAEKVLTKEENLFSVGLDNVHTLRLMLSKEAADNSTTIANQYIYVFSLDRIRIMSDTYTTDAEGVLYAGPYSLINVEGEPLFYSKATCEACTVDDEDSGIEFFLSNDGENYVAVDHSGNAGSIVYFEGGKDPDSYDALDQSISINGLVETSELLDVDIAKEAILNLYIKKDYAKRLITDSVVIKRNIKDASITGLVYQAPPGWNLNSETNTYSTVVYVSNTDGLTLDLGSTSAIVNGVSVSGSVQLPPGYSTFETNSSNWIEIPTGISSLREFHRRDPLYPYNHKYLIEGYVYSSSYNGDIVYSGVEEYFGNLLAFVPSEEFNKLDANRLDVFTVEEKTDGIFFKVKVDKTDASWRQEFFSIDWLLAGSKTNQIWVKAILRSYDSSRTPILESFKIRAI